MTCGSRIGLKKISDIMETYLTCSENRIRQMKVLLHSVLRAGGKLSFPDMSSTPTKSSALSASHFSEFAAFFLKTLVFYRVQIILFYLAK
jgi:hypothetical protein